MKSFSVVLLIFIFYNFHETSARSVQSRIEKWLNMKMEDVREQCESNDKTQLENDGIAQFNRQIDEYVGKDEDMNLSHEDYYFNVTYNPKMLQALKNVIKNIQNCLDEDDRLKPEELVVVINKVLTMHANRVLKISPTIQNDITDCFPVMKLEQCAKPYMHLVRGGPGFSNRQLTILQVLVPAYVISSSCTEVYPLEQCFMKYMHKCSGNAKRYFQVVLSPSYVIDGICENFLQSTDIDISEEINDIFHKEGDAHDDHDDNNDDSLKRLFHM
ncbi:uncharacterized protein LOC122498527 [Leptopilina heterotoma]|uniref:uncharacterized protein LOC122498527 n=1 Tax=Leptopilina heterotoma TaxID=63436 RepID=UPI001CA84E9B|nr:uncharacterized protein LOC122498527 [Leptopilina heterotoma]